MAAELVLFSILSALPLLLSLTSILGVLDQFVGEDLASRIESTVRRRVDELVGTSPQVTELLDAAFSFTSTTVFTVGFVGSLYAASRGFVSLVGSLDTIFTTTSTRSWIGQRGVGIALAIGSTVLFPLSLLVASTSSNLADALTANPTLRFVADRCLEAFGIALAVAWITTLYHQSPSDRRTWRSHVPGAAVCVASAIVVTELAGLWFATLGTNPVYGAIGAILGLFWWAYFVACAFFVGAEVTVWRLERQHPPQRIQLPTELADGHHP